MWWNGRHACLRDMWRELWGFKSPRRHHKKESSKSLVPFYNVRGALDNYRFSGRFRCVLIGYDADLLGV